jgi:hypothetical protein
MRSKILPFMHCFLMLHTDVDSGELFSACLARPKTDTLMVAYGVQRKRQLAPLAFPVVEKN